MSRFISDYTKLIEYGLNLSVAAELWKHYKTGKISPSDIDDRALHAMKECYVHDAIEVIQTIPDSKLINVQNKSDYLADIINSLTQRSNEASKGLAVSTCHLQKGNKNVPPRIENNILQPAAQSNDTKLLRQFSTVQSSDAIPPHQSQLLPPLPPGHLTQAHNQKR